MLTFRCSCRSGKQRRIFDTNFAKPSYLRIVKDLIETITELIDMIF